MSWEKKTGCPYHVQDLGHYCGAAAAMMILAEIGVPYKDLDQDNLYESNHSHNKSPLWFTGPYGLAYTLVDRRPEGFNNIFVVKKPDTETEGTRDIVHTLWKYGVSPAAIVFGGGHWLVVKGVQTDVEPAAGINYIIEGLWINNPVYHETPPPPPHDNEDDCGTGGTLGLGEQFVTYQFWQDTYFTGCNYDAPNNNLQFISVCDPDPGEIELPGRRPGKFRTEGKTFILATDAVKFVEDEFNVYNIYKNREAANALKGATPGKSHLVMRLDKFDSYYYLVPWQKEGKITAIAQVDALRGELQSLQLFNTPVRGLFISRHSATTRIANRKFDVPAGKKQADSLPEIERQLFRPGAYSLAPTLVWKPCPESFSPHLPFYQFTMGEHKIYVRVDGKVFNKLSPLGRGM